MDDHIILRKGIVQILKQDFQNAEFTEASNGQEALKHLLTKTIDLALLDISMPGIDGIEVLKQIKAFNIDCPIIVLSMQPEEQYAVRSIVAGAKGYLKKDAEPTMVVKAVKKVLSGKKFISEAVADLLADSVNSKKSGTLHQLLSDREMQVLHLLGQGKTISEIANEISLSANTVSTYRSRIMEKLNLNSKASLIKYAIDNKLT